MVHAEVHTPMDPPEPEIPTEAQIPYEALDQGRHPATPNDPVQEENRGISTTRVTYSTSTTKMNGSTTTITSGFTYAQTNAIA